MIPNDLSAVVRSGALAERALSVVKTNQMMMQLLLVFFAFCLGACEVVPGEEDCVDLRQEWEPLLADSYYIEVPTIVVPGGVEAMHCLYGTYEGPNAGIVSFFPEEPEGFLHHSLLKRVDDDEYSDGTMFDCTAEEFQVPPKPTLVESYNVQDGDWVGLPEGIGFKMKTGQRWVTDIHYVNTSPDPICVNTAFELELLPEEELHGYAGTYNLDAGKLAIPPDGESSLSFGCAWPSDVNVLSVAGHMHGNGVRYDVFEVLEEGELRPVYQVDPWLPEHRYQAPYINYEVGEFTMSAGEVLQTECTWNNPTSETMGYPDEMCTTFGVAYPLETSFHCDGGEIVGQGP